MSQVQDVFGGAAPKSVLNKPLLWAMHTEPIGAGGGDSVAGNQTRKLNTIEINQIPGASIANDLITLPPGEYYIEGWAQAFKVGVHKAKFQTDANQTVIEGTPANANSAETIATNSIFAGQITVEATTVYKVTHFTTEAFATGGLGLQAGSTGGVYHPYVSVRIWKLDSNVETPVISDPSMVLARPLMHAREQQAATTDGGSSVSGWNDRVLNTVLVNEISGASLVANQITLPAGTYHIEATAPSVGGGLKNRLFIRDDADNKLIAGPTSFDGGAGEGDLATVSGRLILAATTTIKISHNIATARATTGLGDASAVEPEVYAEIRIWQLDAVNKQPVLVNDKLYPLPGNVIVTGNMHGLEYEYTAPNEITVQAGICMDSVNETVLTLTNPQLVTIPGGVNTVYNLFLTDDSQLVKTDTDVDGANLPAQDKRRWIGFVRTNASGEVTQFHMTGDRMWFNGNHTDTQFGTTPTVAARMPVENVLPVSLIPRLRGFYLGAGPHSTTGVIRFFTGPNNSDITISGPYVAANSYYANFGPFYDPSKIASVSTGTAPAWVQQVEMKR